MAVLHFTADATLMRRHRSSLLLPILSCCYHSCASQASLKVYDYNMSLSNTLVLPTRPSGKPLTTAVVCQQLPTPCDSPSLEQSALPVAEVSTCLIAISPLTDDHSSHHNLEPSTHPPSQQKPAASPFHTTPQHHTTTSSTAGTAS